MSFEIGWYVDGQVIKGELWGSHSLDDLVAANKILTDLLDGGSKASTHIVLSDEKIENMPTSLLAIRQALTYTIHANLGWLVMVGGGQKGVKDFMIQFLADVNKARFHRASTFDDAFNHLKTVDESINWGKSE